MGSPVSSSVWLMQWWFSYSVSPCPSPHPLSVGYLSCVNWHASFHFVFGRPLFLFPGISTFSQHFPQYVFSHHVPASVQLVSLVFVIIQYEHGKKNANYIYIIYIIMINIGPMYKLLQNLKWMNSLLQWLVARTLFRQVFSCWDSKTLTEEQREKIFKKIDEAKDSIGWIVDILSPNYISTSMLRRWYIQYLYLQTDR